MALAASTNPVVVSLAGGRDTAAVDLGVYYSAISPTPGTAVLCSATVTAFTETTPLMVVFNGGTLNIYPIHLQLRLGTAGTGASAATFFTNTLDVGNRFSSGGSTLTKNNLNGNSVLTSAAVVSFGAVTASAATGSRRIIGHAPIRSLATGVIHDTVSVNWGAAEQTLVSTLINNSTTHSDTIVNWAPCVIAPGQSMVLVEWGVSAANAKSYEVNFSYIEK
jgi:hypothetical protein